MQGKSVRLFLVDGTSTGIITAEIMNWTGHVLETPRSRLAEALKRNEARRTGVYLLLGDDPDNPSRQMVYVGEGDTVGHRVRAHATDESKEFWTRTCLITSKDKNLTKAHVRYLEGQLIELIRIADRASLANAKDADVNDSLPESDTSDMQYFLSQMEVTLPVVGIDVLRQKPKPLPKGNTGSRPEDISTIELVLSVKKHGYEATAAERDGEFVVLKGSTSLANPQHTYNAYETLRNQLIDDGVLATIADNTKHLIFTTDYVFKSPSAAASVINGRNSNGRTEWLVKPTGQTLKEYQDSQLPELAPGEITL